MKNWYDRKRYPPVVKDPYTYVILLRRDGKVVHRIRRAQCPGPTVLNPVIYKVRDGRPEKHDTFYYRCTFPIFMQRFTIMKWEDVEPGIVRVWYDYVGLERSNKLMSEREKTLDPKRFPA